MPASAASTTVPGTTYPVGTTDTAVSNVPGGKITTLSCKIDCSLFTDPGTTITVSLQQKLTGQWNEAAAITQVGSPTGTWATKFGTTNFGVDFEIVYGTAVNVTQVQFSITVVGSPVTLGDATLSWA